MGWLLVIHNQQNQQCHCGAGPAICAMLAARWVSICEAPYK